MKKNIIAAAVIAAVVSSISAYIYYFHYKTKTFDGVEFVRIDNGKDPAFLMGRYEITQEQYESIMHINPSYFKGNSDNPAESLTQRNMMEFCIKLSIVCGLEPYYSFDPKDPYVIYTQASADGFRLPTGDEWERAMQGDAKTLYYWGEEINDEYLWYKENSENKPHPVGKKKPNQYGLYDMSGNLMEVVLDRVENEELRAGLVGGDYTTSGNRTFFGAQMFASKFIIYVNMSDLQNNCTGFRLVKNKI